MDNFYRGQLDVFITTDCLCTVNVNVSTPLFDPSFTTFRTVNGKQVIKVSFNHAIRGIGTELSNKGIEIKSSKEITVYAVNKERVTTDAYVVFPVDTLGYMYYVITWTMRSTFMIVATDDNTNVEITVGKTGSSIIFNSATYTAGMTFSITMNKYQTFHAFGNLNSDYSGTRIKSSKVVTVISGSKCSKVGGGACDHLSSQMTPIDTFGKKYVTLNMPNCNVPVDFKIIASEKNTIVNIFGGVPVHMSTPGDLHSFQITDQSSRTIKADKPIAVAFFAEGGCAANMGDPAMVLLPPIEQFAADYTFSTIETSGNPFQNALTVIITSAEINGLLLDGNHITSHIWRQVQGRSDLRIADINITDGSHTIYHTNPTVTFLAVSTGIAKTNSYGYIAGQRLAPINSVSDH